MDKKLERKYQDAFNKWAALHDGDVEKHDLGQHEWDCDVLLLVLNTL